MLKCFFIIYPSHYKYQNIYIYLYSSYRVIINITLFFHNVVANSMKTKGSRAIGSLFLLQNIYSY